MKIKSLILTALLIAGTLFVSAKNRALLIGIGDYNTEATGWDKLSGSNDVDLLEGKLTAKGFTVSSLKDSSATKKNVMAALSKLVSSAQSGDVVFIHFSGHGQLVQDMNNDEPDGMDQSFVCYDACYTPRYTMGGSPYKGQNHLIDDELFPYLSQLKSKVGSNGRIIVTFDSCYSGGIDRGEIMDDPDPESEVEFVNVVRGTNDEFLANKNSKQYLKSIKAPGFYADNGGELVVVSACQRNSKNWETREKHSGKGYGSLTYCVAKLLDNDVPMSEWEDFFNTHKYRSYRIFRSSQHPVVERH